MKQTHESQVDQDDDRLPHMNPQPTDVQWPTESALLPSYSCLHLLSPADKRI